ncbi:MAG: SAM-dependent methyltransferase Dde2880 (UbiE -like) [Nitrospira sp.]|nr:MAG: SAM-dependent methyltransferase Dde2880 (UbiE -like) [Nitrospira sp.]
MDLQQISRPDEVTRAAEKRDSDLTWEEAVLWLRDQPDQGPLVLACFYDDPLLEAAKRYASSTEWQAIRSYLPAVRGRALDLGAGRGIASFALARDGWAVTAVEPDPSAIVGTGAIRRLAEEGGFSIDVVDQRGEELPFQDEFFDLVHCRAVLHHARDLAALCREVGRVLKPGGILIATREHVISRKEDLELFLEAHPLHRLYGGEYAYLLAEYRVAIERAGLTIMTVLNPYASDINLFPDSRAGLRQRIATRFQLPSPAFVPGVLLDWVGAWSSQPGRLYSFIAGKLLHA